MLFKQNTRADQPATKPTDHLPPIKSTDGLPSLKSADSAKAGKLPLPSAPAPTAGAGPIAPAAGDAFASATPAYDEAETGKRLIVEGQVEVTMNATRTLEIAPSGHFIGSCEVEEADVSGVYDGDLTVRGRLIVHHNGRVTGKICYGELELERGGEISGELSVRPRQGGQAAAPAQGSDSRRNAA